ncbi:DUF6625 family protein [Endozoicomonas ascidiicola]|uniref:DUF6625 family protein n=1 Tax=Endozoicomonas ascidiicola TaxID=1698521 RepID=UPI00083080FA|nr:DUF6625 family protein [Endozoicomonas ascidiicola]
MRRKSIFIVNYFGAWPFWFPFFLMSCAKNEDYHWLIITDCNIPENAPPNVTFLSTTLEEYTKRISDTLQIRLNIQRPYKLCDLRPALGVVHDREIEGYEFWGYCDVDVIFGDINSFITDEKMDKYQLITSHSRRVSGHLTLIKNCDEMKELYKKIPGWEMKMSSEKHYSFDEKGFSELFVRHKNFPEKIRKAVSKLYTLPRMVSMEEAYSTPNMKHAWVDGSYNFPKMWVWNAGKLTTDINGDREFPYLHFKHWKDFIWPNLNVCDLMPEIPVSLDSKWSISADGFRLIG